MDIVHPGPNHIHFLISVASNTLFELSHQNLAPLWEFLLPVIKTQIATLEVRSDFCMMLIAAENLSGHKCRGKNGMWSLKHLPSSTTVVQGLSAFPSKPQFSEFITQLF